MASKMREAGWKRIADRISPGHVAVDTCKCFLNMIHKSPEMSPVKAIAAVVNAAATAPTAPPSAHSSAQAGIVSSSSFAS